METKTIYVNRLCLDRLKQMVASSDLFNRSRPVFVSLPRDQNDAVVAIDVQGSPKNLETLENYNRGLSDAFHQILPAILKETFHFQRCNI